MTKQATVVARRAVCRGGVSVGGARYFAEALQTLQGVVLDIVVRPDGSAFTDFPGGRLELEQRS